MERIRHRGDVEQAGRFGRWLERVRRDFADANAAHFRPTGVRVLDPFS